MTPLFQDNTPEIALVRDPFGETEVAMNIARSGYNKGWFTYDGYSIVNGVLRHYFVLAPYHE